MWNTPNSHKPAMVDRFLPKEHLNTPTSFHAGQFDSVVLDFTVLSMFVLDKTETIIE